MKAGGVVAVRGATYTNDKGERVQLCRRAIFAT